MSTTHEHIIQSTGASIDRQGFHGAGLDEIVKESSAERLALLLFSGGDEQIASEAILLSVCRV